MDFIKTTTKKEAWRYIYLAEGYRKNSKVEQPLLKKFGLLDEFELEESRILEQLKQEAKDGRLTNSKMLHVSYDLLAPLHQANQSYGWMVLDNLFESLEFKALPKGNNTKSESDLLQVLKLLVFQHLLQPDSKLATYDSQADLFGD